MATATQAQPPVTRTRTRTVCERPPPHPLLPPVPNLLRNCQLQIAVGTAGPQLVAVDDWALPDLKCKLPGAVCGAAGFQLAAVGCQTSCASSKVPFDPNCKFEINDGLSQPSTNVPTASTGNPSEVPELL